MSDTPSAAQTAVSEYVTMVLRLQDNACKRGILNLWTIYDKPRDYPTGIVARLHQVDDGRSSATHCMLMADLELLRNVFRDAGLVCICRQENDDHRIVESWI